MTHDTIMALSDAYANAAVNWIASGEHSDEARAALSAAIADLIAERDALAKDAARYRWIARKVSAHGICDGWQFGFPTALTLPANALAMSDPEKALGECIDSAMKGTPT